VTEVSPRRTARVVLLSTLVMLASGSCGAANGIGGLQAETPTAVGDEVLDVEAASAATAAAMMETLYRAPLRRALATANIVASMLLIVAAALLLSRRSTAPWWVGQATLANTVLVVGDGASKVAQLWIDRDSLSRVFDQEIALRLAAEGSSRDEVPLEGGHYLGLLVAGIIGYAVVWAAIYLWIGWRIRRPDVAALLRSA
jgi:hypothetical protein